MAQQTAVGFLINQLRKLSNNPKTYLGLGDVRVSQGYIDDIEEQAKQIEKEKMKEDLIDFQIYLNDEGYIENHDWDFEKEAIVYLHKSK